jgi:hypothetical protein
VFLVLWDSIAYSYDGITWTGITLLTIFSSQSRGISWNGTRFIAVGQGINTVAYSSDGITWTGLGSTSPASPFTSIGYNVAWNAGLGGVVMTSTTLNEYGSGLSNRLDVVADEYFNQGFSNLTLTINA